MLDKGCSYHLRCEDRQTECFVRYLLGYQGIDVRRKLKVLPFAPGNCAEAYVRRMLPDDLRRCRAMNYRNICLIVVTDADINSCQDKEKMLITELRKHGMDIEKNDCILMWLPKRNIESWIKHFREGVDDETTDFKHFLKGKESGCKPEAIKMCEELIRNTLADSKMSSLALAQDSYNKVCEQQATR